MENQPALGVSNVVVGTSSSSSPRRDVTDLTVIRAILSLKKSKERLKELAETIGSKNDILIGINNDLKKGVQAQMALNKMLETNKALREHHASTAPPKLKLRVAARDGVLT